MTDTANNAANPILKSFADLPRRKKTLAELAAGAMQAQAAGEETAEVALQGEELTAAERAAIEKDALGGNEESREALQYLDEAKEAIFVDAFARAGYSRGRIAQIHADPHPHPETVLATIFSALSAKMRVRGAAPKSAIPLLKAHRSRREAQLYVKSPIVFPASFRKNVGDKGEVIAARGENYLAPMTSADREVFVQVRNILAKMPEVFTAWVEDGHRNLRSALWLGLHFMPGGQVLDKTWISRTLKDEGGVLKHLANGRAYLRFDLSGNEILILEDSDLARRVMDRFKVLAEQKA